MLEFQNAMDAKGKLGRGTILTINSMNQSYEERGRSLLNGSGSSGAKSTTI
jgi:hypothetical protein